MSCPRRPGGWRRVGQRCTDSDLLVPATTYHVTIGERVVRVQVRRDGERYLVRVDDGEERPAQLSSVHGPLHSLRLGDHVTEVLAIRDRAGVSLSVAGLEYRAEVLDEAHARLAS